MAVEQARVLDALKVVQDPDLHRDIVSLGFIKDLTISGGTVGFTIELTTPACPVKDQMRDQARAASPEGLSDPVGLDHPTPLLVHDNDVGATALGDLDQEQAEPPALAHHHAVSRLHQ